MYQNFLTAEQAYTCTDLKEQNWNFSAIPDECPLNVPSSCIQNDDIATFLPGKENKEVLELEPCNTSFFKIPKTPVGSVY